MTTTSGRTARMHSVNCRRFQTAASGVGLRNSTSTNLSSRSAAAVVSSWKFSRPGQRLSFSNHDAYQFEDWFSCWELWAADPAGFSDLTGRLCRILPTLSRLLAASESGGGDAEIPF